MDESKALEIVQRLADGVDPDTGEVFSADSPYQQPNTIRALHTAAAALETVEKQTSEKEAAPNGRASHGPPKNTAGQEKNTKQAKHPNPSPAPTTAPQEPSPPRLTKLSLLHPLDD